jgi:hypothetical protein
MRKQLEQCARDFERVLTQQYAPKTVCKHTAIIALFIDFVCWDTDVRRIEGIMRGIANSYFRQWYLGYGGQCSARRPVPGPKTDDTLASKMRAETSSIPALPRLRGSWSGTFHADLARICKSLRYRLTSGGAESTDELSSIWVGSA